MQALGIGIVVPQFLAGQDRWWAPHKGTLPGALTMLPYRAPLDHILDLERGLGKNLPEAEFGRNIPFRESSFLENPRLPAAVRGSVLRIELCDANADGSFPPDCADGSEPVNTAVGHARLRPGLTDAQLQTALGAAAERFSTLKFSGIAGAFGGHAERQDAARFDKRIRNLPSLWCCVEPPPGKPGHVWYDLWWDTVPHKDLHGRRWDEPWHIVTGP